MNPQEYELNPEILTEHVPVPGELGTNEQELLGELMRVNSEPELEYFLGNLWDGAVRLYKSPQGQAVKRDFISGAKQFGRKMIPSIGKNLGGYFGGERGAKFGGQIGSALGGLFADNENEAVNYLRVIHKAANYLNNALRVGTNIRPNRLVNQAINTAARGYIRPGWTGRNPILGAPIFKGRWIRRANQIILLGVW